MKISKWGNSLAILLPSVMVDTLKLREGDDIEFIIEGHRVVCIAKKPEREALLSELRRFRGKLPPDFKFDRNEANGRSGKLRNSRADTN